MENKNTPPDRQLFHSQLDLPDRPAPSVKQPQNAQKPSEQTADRIKAAPKPSQPKNIHRANASGSASHRTDAGGSTSRRTAASSSISHRTQTAKHTNQCPGHQYSAAAKE